jgi:hypothetical protein
MADSAARVVIEGDARLRAELNRAADMLDDLRPVNRDAAQIIASAASPRTPRKTGRLAASVSIVATPDDASVSYGAPYARAVHSKRPWLYDAAVQTEPRVIARYYEELDRVLANIEGGP